MGSILSTTRSTFLQGDGFNLNVALSLSTIIVASGIILSLYVPYLQCMCKKFVRICIRKLLIDRNLQPGDNDAFLSHYRDSLCNFQEVNNELLRKILEDNSLCQNLTDQQVSSLSSLYSSSASHEEKRLLIDEFRQKFPLTTYENYRECIDRMVNHGEKNMLSVDKIIYFATSSGTTGTMKLLPITPAMLKETTKLTCLGQIAIWRSLPKSIFPTVDQRLFSLQTPKKSDMFLKSSNGTPIGPLSQIMSAISYYSLTKKILSLVGIIDVELIEDISDFETTAFIQLVFALVVHDIYCYSVIFAPAFLHSVKLIENHFEEMCLCIASADFYHSSLVRKNIHDVKLRKALNQALEKTALEYGGLSYRSERVNHIRNECLKVNTPGLLHRLWPKLIYATTSMGSSFSSYKPEIEFYCGNKLWLVNFLIYGASESFFASLACIHTNEYFLSPTSAFFEFIKEEDVHQAQPKTLLLSEIQPGHRYELVCTTISGLIRYRMGDIVNCTRFLAEADDAVPVPFERSTMPKIPLFSVAYRAGNLLTISGENTTEQHVMDALQQTVQIWKQRDIHVTINNFTLYPQLNAFPARYVMFLELAEENSQHADKTVSQQYKLLQDNSVLFEIERQLCQTNRIYKDHRDSGRLGPIHCILVHSGTFSTFLHKKLANTQVSSVQIKPRRFLKNDEHIQFFYDHQIDVCSLL